MMPSIQAFTEMPEVYAKDINKCKTIFSLCETLESYIDIAEDAFDARPANAESFKEFRAGLLLERKGEFAGEAWAKKYGAIVMPELIFKVALYASNFGVPWGLMFIRLRETGHIVRSTNNAYRFVENKDEKK